MTAQEVSVEWADRRGTLGVPPTRLLASALLHVLDRDEPLPPRWRAEPFVGAVALYRETLASARTVAELETLAAARLDRTFRAAVAALGSDPLAVAVAVRRVELDRGLGLPDWPVILRHGIGTHVSHADVARWFG